MSSVAEIESAIAKLSLQEQGQVAEWLITRLGWESSTLLTAIDEADRSLAEEGGIELDDARRDLRRWITE